MKKLRIAKKRLVGGAADTDSTSDVNSITSSIARGSDYDDETGDGDSDTRSEDEINPFYEV